MKNSAIWDIWYFESHLYEHDGKLDMEYSASHFFILFTELIVYHKHDILKSVDLWQTDKKRRLMTGRRFILRIHRLYSIMLQMYCGDLAGYFDTLDNHVPATDVDISSELPKS